MFCMPLRGPGWGCIIAMFRQHEHPPTAGCPGCAGSVVWPGCWACTVVDNMLHIIELAMAAAPAAWVAA
jgi:hypothetical protein